MGIEYKAVSTVERALWEMFRDGWETIVGSFGGQPGAILWNVVRELDEDDTVHVSDVVVAAALSRLAACQVAAAEFSPLWALETARQWLGQVGNPCPELGTFAAPQAPAPEAWTEERRQRPTLRIDRAA